MDESRHARLHHWAQNKGLSPEADGYSFSAGNGIHGHIKWSADGSCIYATAFLNAQAALRSLPALLEALSLNLFFEATKGGAIAYDSALNDLVLTHTIYGENYDELTLSNTVSNLVAFVDSVRAVISDCLVPEPSRPMPYIDGVHNLKRVQF